MQMQIKPAGPIAQMLGFIVGVLVLIAAVIIGSFVLSAFVGLALLLGTVFYARMWWLRRKIRRAMARGEVTLGRGDRIIETEYHVIDVSEEVRPPNRGKDGARKR